MRTWSERASSRSWPSGCPLPVEMLRLLSQFVSRQQGFFVSENSAALAGWFFARYVILLARIICLSETIPQRRPSDFPRMRHYCQARIKSALPQAPVCGLRPLIRLVAFTCCLIYALFAAAQTGDTPSPSAAEKPLILGEATVSELVKNGIPFNSAVAFSISLDRIYCFTDFVEVGAKTVIYHNWYYRNEKRTSVKLALRPPRWATFSSITLRDSEKGPWQVEITTENGEVLKILRFSVID